MRAKFALESTGQTHTMSEQDLARAIDRDRFSGNAGLYEHILAALKEEEERKLALVA